MRSGDMMLQALLLALSSRAMVPYAPWTPPAQHLLSIWQAAQRQGVQYRT